MVFFLYNFNSCLWYCRTEKKLGKLSNYSLAKIEDIYNVETVKSKSLGKREGYIRDTLKINQQDRYHYLPKFDIIAESVIDFNP